jgi:ferredoxin-NADP reductase
MEGQSMAILHAAHSKLLSNRIIAVGTLECRFERPPGFEFRAGQSLDLTLVKPAETDAEGDTRTYSIASPPAAHELAIATRLRGSAFKKNLASGKPGLKVSIEGPAGSFLLHHKVERPAVFLAGGIGITPFMSMLRQAALDGDQRRFTLFYSNHRPEEAAFLEELEALDRGRRLHFRMIATMTDMPNSKRPWFGEREKLTPDFLRKHLGKLEGPAYYVAGPPGLVADMKRSLLEAGADEDDVRSEEFTGY